MPRPSRYPAEVKELAIQQCAIQNGDIARTRVILKSAGHNVSYATIFRWLNQNAERYAELREQYALEIQKRMGDRALEMAEEAAKGTDLYVKKAIGQVDQEMPAKDAAVASRNLSQAFVNYVDKGLHLRGQATEIHDIRSMDEQVQVLINLGVIRGAEPEIDGEAEEEVPEIES